MNRFMKKNRKRTRFTAEEWFNWMFAQHIDCGSWDRLKAIVDDKELGIAKFTKINKRDFYND